MKDAFGEMLHTKLFWITTIVAIIYVYLKYFVFNYWNRRGVPYDPPLIPFGNMLPVFLGKMSLSNAVKNSYEKFKKHRFFGIYMLYQPLMIISDPELIRQVLIKEFNKFHDRGLYFNEEVDPLSGHLFFLPGEKWKKLRAKLSPIFTSGKLKQMFPFIKEIGDELITTAYQTIEKNNVVDLKCLSGRYTTDTISSTAFGINCKSLENPDNDFKRHIHMVFDQSPLKLALGTYTPTILDILRIPFTPQKTIEFFSKAFEDMVNYRKQNKVVRKDFVNLLMQLLEKGLLEDDEKLLKNGDSKTVPDSEKLNMVQAQAQAFVFFVAGYETTSSTITYCLYELAMNPSIQEKVYAEVDETYKKAGGLTYDSVVNEYEYLYMAFCETLRKHPSLGFLNRICREDWDIPNSNVQIKKGESILIPVSGIQRDPNFYPDPDKFDPERFSKENIAKRSPYVYLPFGDGPRVCIGTRFGVLQSKVALISLIFNFKFSICDESPIPLEYSKRAFVQTPASAVYLKMEKRNK